MSVTRNVSISLFSQAFFVATRLLVVPIYLRLMGVEAYGLVGLFVLFTALIQLLNLGVSSTTSREISRLHAGAASASSVRRQLRQSIAILSPVALTFAGGVALGAPYIAAHWLHVVSIPSGEVIASLRLMAAAAALSLIANLFKGGLLGLERQVTLNLANMIAAALRAVGVVGALLVAGPTPVVFCAFQLAVSVGELVVVGGLLNAFLPKASVETALQPVAERLGQFAAGIAFTEIVWLAVLQCDRAVLSTALPLTAFGYFTAMTTAAYGVMLLATPVAQSLQPRFTILATAAHPSELRQLYMQVSYGLSALLGTAAGVMIFFPRTLMYAWTGHGAIADWAAPVLPIYAAGNALVGLLSLPYLLQFALGDIKVHVWGHVASALGYIPAAIWLGFAYGAEGTGAAWLTMNALYFLIAVPLIHARVLPGGHAQWLFGRVLPGLGIPLVMIGGCSLLPLTPNRLVEAMSIVAFATAALAVSVSANRGLRTRALSYLLPACGAAKLGGRGLRP